MARKNPTTLRGHVLRKMPTEMHERIRGVKSTPAAKRMAMTHISDGNSKIGKIHNVSLTMFSSCPKAPCVNKGLCYAYKAWLLHPEVKIAWSDNLWMAQHARAEFFYDIEQYLKNKKSKPYFRWHASGDFPDQDYFDRTVLMARKFPQTQFLAFTKRHGFDFASNSIYKIPPNYSVVLSYWPGWGNEATARKNGLRCAWVRIGQGNKLGIPAQNDPRIPANAVPCPGSCKDCKRCWHLGRLKKDIVFDIH